MNTTTQTRTISYYTLFALLCSTLLMSLSPCIASDAVRSRRYHYTLDMKHGERTLRDTTIIWSTPLIELQYQRSTYHRDTILKSPDGRAKLFELEKKVLLSNTLSSVPSSRTLPEYLMVRVPEQLIHVYESDRLYAPITYSEPVPSLDWSISESDTRLISGYMCHWAVCDFHGHTFEAWFTRDHTDGVSPWKLRGLPGLVVEVYDTHRLFEWRLLDISDDTTMSTLSDLLPVAPERYVSVDRQAYLRDTHHYLTGAYPKGLTMLSTIVESDARRGYVQRSPKKLLPPAIESDYLDEDGGSDPLLSESSALHESKGHIADSSALIPGIASADHLLLQYSCTVLSDTLTHSSYRPDIQLVEYSPERTVWYSYRSYEMVARYSTKEGKKEWKWQFDRGVERLRATGSRQEFMNAFPRMGTREVVVRSHTGHPYTIQVYDAIDAEHVVYSDTLCHQWQLLDSTQVVMGLQCQLAETTFRGRVWHAWFAPEVPVSIGPWKFAGLQKIWLVYNNVYLCDAKGDSSTNL